MKRILVVDDDRGMVRTLCDILALHGWTADARHSGEEAVAAVEESDFDAILMDVRMGGIDGVEALRRIRERRPRARVFLMTAYSSSDLLRQAVEEGALQILSKPVALPTLLPLLDSALRNGDPVLVVDDDVEFLRTLGDVLRARGYRTLEATSLGEALGILARQQPVAAVLDLRLDDLEPRDVVLAVRRVSPGVSVILCSGYPRLIEEATAEAPPGMIHGAVRKPCPPETLLAMLDHVLHS